MRRFLVLILLSWILTSLLLATPGCGCDSYAAISETLGMDEYAWNKTLQDVRELQAKEAEALSGPGLVQEDCSSWITDKEILLEELEDILSDCEAIKSTEDCPSEYRQRADNLETTAKAAEAWLRKNLAALKRTSLNPTDEKLSEMDWRLSGALSGVFWCYLVLSCVGTDGLQCHLMLPDTIELVCRCLQNWPWNSWEKGNARHKEWRASCIYLSGTL